MAEANVDTQENYDLDTSRRLNSILNDHGLTKKSISDRRYSMQLINSLLHIKYGSMLNCRIAYMSGSTVEGVASIFDQTSDVDTMEIAPINVINATDQIDNQVKHFPIQNGVYILEDSISHCLFKRLRYFTGEIYADNYYHRNGYIYLSHTNIPGLCHNNRKRLTFLNDTVSTFFSRNNMSHRVENCGPSTATSTEFFLHDSTLSTHKYGIDMDFVYSVFCPFWPREIGDFFVRHRTQQWPTPRDLDWIIRNGCHLVAKGFEGSIEYNIEWRLSFSFAENILIRSFNNIQMKCYFLLKKFLKRDIKPLFPQLLCSYHMKTVMFWVCEEIGSNMFKQQFLLKCFRLCIERIRSYLLEGNFPCYFARESNLLSETVPREKYRKLAKFLSIVYREETITTFVGFLNEQSQFFKHTILPVQSCLPAFTIPLTLKTSMSSYKSICERKTGKEVQSFLNWLITDIIKRNLLIAYPEWNGMNSLRQIVFPDLSHIAIAFLHRGQLRNKVHYVLQKQYLHLMANELAVTHSSGLLKRATVYYKIGQFTRCMVITVNVINLLTATRAICCGVHGEEIYRVNNPLLFLEILLHDEIYVTPNVTFSELDKQIVPDFVIEEINFDEQIDEGSTKGWAFFDPVIYAYGLAIICQHEQSDFASRDQFLQELQNFFLQNKHRIGYQNSAKRIIDHFIGLTATTDTT